MAHCWCFTWNNYGDKVPIYKERTMHYIIWAPQVAPTTGTPHLQGYVQFKKPKAASEAHKMITSGRAKIKVIKARGSWQHNYAYIAGDEKQTNSGPTVIHGEPQEGLENSPSRQGLRTDLQEVKERLREEKPDVVEEDMPDMWARYPQYMVKCELQRKKREPIEWPLKVWGVEVTKPDPAMKKRHWWFWGPPDIGKTRTIGEATKGKAVFWAPTEAKYRFENYRNEELIIYDDVIPELSELINVSNHAYGQQQRPGGRRYTAGYWEEGTDRTIIVLSNSEPNLWPASFYARFNVMELKAQMAQPAAAPAGAAAPAAPQQAEEEWFNALF